MPQTIPKVEYVDLSDRFQRVPQMRRIGSAVPGARIPAKPPLSDLHFVLQFVVGLPLGASIIIILGAGSSTRSPSPCQRH